MDVKGINSASISEDIHAGESEMESNNMDSLEVMSSNGDTMRELESTAEVLTRVELDLACFSEKLLNLDILVMHVASRESDFEAFVSDEGKTFGDSAKNALEFDLLSGILESELKEIDNFIITLQVEIDNARETVASSKHLGEAFTNMHEKFLDCEKSLKQSLEQVSEIKGQSGNFQRVSLSCSGVKVDKDMESFENGYFSDLNSKIKMQTAEQQRHILRMFENSLAREMDLEKKLTDLRQSEEMLKLRLQQEVFCMEEEVEVSLEKLFEAENTAEFLFGTSKELTSQLQLVKFNLNGYIQREGELRSKCQEQSEQLRMKDIALQKSESTILELTEKLSLSEKQVKECELLKDSAEEERESCSKIHELEDLISHLNQKVSEAEKRADNAEAECKLLRDTNTELSNELSLVKNSGSTTSARVILLERQLRESDIQLQHAVASAEASQEKQTMLYSTIKDMEDLIGDLKSRVSKAKRQTDSAEEKCIILSESNSDLNEEIKHLRSRMQRLEASLHQAEETKRATAKDIGIRSKLITDLIIQLAMERERLHKQISSLTKEKKVLLKRSQHMTKDHSESASKDIEERISSNDFSGATSLKECKSETEFSATSNELDSANKDVPTGGAEVGVAESATNLDASRNIDARQLKFKHVLMAIFVFLVSAIVATLFQNPRDQF